MPRLIVGVPKYRKHRASGQAIVTLAGKDFYLGPHGTAVSKREYDRLVHEWLAAGRSPSFGAAPDQLTMVELIAAYLRFAKPYYGEGNRGELTNMKRPLRLLRELYGKTNPAEFGPQQFKAVREKLVAEALSRTYINAVMKRLCRFFRWAASEGHIPASTPQTLSMIPGLRRGRSGVRETSPVRPVDPADVEATLPFLSGVVAAMVRTQLHTGARPGEICSLRGCDIDRSNDVWEARLAEHKTAHHGQDRTIYFGPQAQAIILPFLEREADAFLFSPAEAMAEVRQGRSAARKTPLSCGNRPGTKHAANPKRTPQQCYTTQSYGRAIARAAKLAGVPRWSPNQLRHWVATRVRRDYDLDAAKTLLGHSQVGTTQLYAEKDRRRAIEVAREIG